jgi:hypothetical protein
VLLFPNTHVPGSRRLPLIMCPYGGPHHAKAIANGRSHALAQYVHPSASPPQPQPRPPSVVEPPHACAGTSLT